MANIVLPTLRPDQARIYKQRGRHNVLRCGRRFGKTKFITTIAADDAIKARKVGIFTPERKQWTEVYDELTEILSPIKRKSNKTEGAIRTRTRGIIDFWSLNDNELAGRGREYDTVFVDEGAFTKKEMFDIWKKSIEPTLLTTQGRSFICSTPFGTHPDNFFYRICTEKDLGFREFYAPSSFNPKVTPEELARLEKENDPRVFRQEYLAKFINWDGQSFFEKEKWLVDGEPVEYPAHCDGVYAIVDSATKTGKKNDGTAVTFFAISQRVGHRLIVLDWDIVQIEGALLETWLPTIFQHLQVLAVACKARAGSLGVFIEDKDSGQILIQQARNRGWPATAIDSKLTSMGKSERAINVSGYHYQGLVKISRHAYNKVTTYKQIARNHFLMQVLGFRIGVEDQADDLLDTYTYGLAIGLGNAQGF